jgi:tRNA/tmRNA/rRNA uracil-C5-methylase (TrmA/RlmC/RlmD family)
MSCKRTARRPPRVLRLTVESLAFGGDAVARDRDGRVTFVPGGAPGDELDAELREEHKAWARAELSRVVKAGPARAEPPCPLYVAEPGCGGCQWQHVAADAQRAAKQTIVARALRRHGAVVRPILAAVPDRGWRRRARLRLRGAQLGYLARRSHRLVDVPACLQMEPALEAALGAVRETIVPRIDGGGEVQLLASARGQVHVVVEAHGALAAMAAAERLMGRAGIAGIVLGDGGEARTLGASEIDLADDPAAPFLARADVFVQVAAAGNAALRALVREAAGSLAGLRVLELCAGSGNFTRDLAATAARVVASEEHPVAAALCARNLAARGLAERVDARAEPTAALLAAAPPADVIVLDPPRTGLNPGEAAALAALPATRAVYVSCDPETLARDLDAFAAAGWRVAWAQPVDLMPMTFHVETVVALAR